MRKTYILDSSVLLSNPRALYAFDDNEVIIPSCVVEEIGDVIRKGGENRANAIEFNNILDEIYTGGSEAVDLPNGGVLKILNAPTIFTASRTHLNSILVSRDTSVRLQAKIQSIPVETYKSDDPLLKNRERLFRASLYVSEDEMSAFAHEKSLTLDKSKTYTITDSDNAVAPPEYRFSENDYLTLINSNNPNGATMLGRYRDGRIVSVRNSIDHPVFNVTPRNVAQSFALDALMDPDIPLVILRGPAGTGKTFLAMAAALQQTLETHLYRRVLLTRPNAKMDADVGFLKGDERDKMLPSLRGLTDNVENLMPIGKKGVKDGVEEEDPLEYLLDRRILEVQALAYMRGRSITNQFIVVDEMQNSTVGQVLSIVTRLGEGSKIVIMGDPDQIDNPYLDKLNNGLIYASDRMYGSKLCCQVTFTERESTRSLLAKEAIERLSPKGSWVNRRVMRG